MPPFPPDTRRRILRGAVLVFFALRCASAHAGEEELFSVRAEGYADGIGAGARDAAVANAKREVVEEVIKSLVVSGDLEPLRPMLRNAANYIQRCEVIRADQSGDSTRVEVEAYVLEKALRQDVAALTFPRLPQPPHVLLLVGEKLPRDQIVAVPDAGLAETVLREGLERLKLQVAGSETLGQTFTQAQLIETVTGGVEAGQRFTLANNADAVVVGAAVVTVEGSDAGNNVRRCRATAELRIYRGYDGKMMDSLTASAVVGSLSPEEGSDQAVRDVCAKLVNETAVSAILTVLGTQASDAVVLTLDNPGSRQRFEELVTRIEVELHLDEIEELYYSDTRARLRVRYDGPIAYLVDVLSAGRYAGKKIEPQRVVGRDMTLRFE
jgi:hypothetical protein